MKKIKLIILTAFHIFALISCEKDDDVTGENFENKQTEMQACCGDDDPIFPPPPPPPPGN
ncbi:hypothetical protein [Aureivirga marina]|uniref:hypothetical protein n=1 Tax=Aureivirga marina TaxID=1182451 RepID=UPI0018C8EE7A|nr:hypothetical protein [Aureivirga marina]